MVALAVILAGLVGSEAQEKILTEEVFDQPPLPPPLNLPLMSPEEVPESGNFISAAHDWPPLPFNYLSTNSEVKVYSLAEAFGKTSGMPFYLIDDRAWVQAKEQAEQEQLALQMLEAAARGEKLDKFTESTPEEPHVAYRGLTPMTNDLQIDIEDATNGIVSLTVLNPTSMTNNPVWDLYATTNFGVEVSGLNGTNWTWLLRTEPGQTNLLVAMLSETEEYFRLAGTNDTDGDFLTDAFEALVSHSDPTLVNSDGDGMTDDYEWAHFGTMAQGDADDFDGDGVGNLAEMNAGFNPSLPDTDGDGRVDELFTVRILSPR